jgi:hypothetical protein
VDTFVLVTLGDLSSLLCTHNGPRLAYGPSWLTWALRLCLPRDRTEGEVDLHCRCCDGWQVVVAYICSQG